MFREVIFYESPEGQKPIQRVLDKLDGKQAKKVAWTLQLVEEQETVPSKYFKKMVNTDDLWGSPCRIRFKYLSIARIL